MDIPYKQDKQQYPWRVTAKIRGAFALGDQPSVNLVNWQGYFRNTDPTILPPNTLTFPSINCFIPNKDKIVPRLGTTLLGQAFTSNKTWPIVGHKKRFATMSGIVVEVRVSKSDDMNLGDILEVLYPNPATGIPEWYAVSQNPNPFPTGVHRYYFDDWFDTNLNPALSFNLSRLIWVNGLPQIFSWTGGIAPIVSIVANTSISTTPGVSWASLGFPDPAIGGSPYIVIRGTNYTITGGWATDTLTLTNTSGIVVNDVAFEAIVSNASPGNIPFDVCRNNKNYMFYGSWNSRKLFMSNQIAHDATAEITSVDAVLNDLVLTGDFTGTKEQEISVKIDSTGFANSDISFSGSGANAVSFDTSGYSLIGTQNTYKVVVYETGGTGSFTTWGWIFFKNGVSTDFGPLQGPTGAVIPGPFTPAGGDGIKFNIPSPIIGSLLPIGVGPYTSYTGALGNGDTWSITVTTASNGAFDTFQWSIDNVLQQQFQQITGAAQALGSTGLSIQFISIVGHSLGDSWIITGDPAILSAWANFYYTLPIRKPDEGYIYQLPSNFWAMAPQEEQMYVNTKYGYWSYVSTVRSADLQSEAVSLTPLKQASSSKVIFPYMMSYLEDYLIYVTEDKKLDMIGRQKLLQLPQTRSLSQPVAIDFQEATFEDGSMEYWDQRLWITSPKENVMLCYDNQPTNKYWQPPQVIPENGILSIVDNTLISHSNIRNQTFNLFTGTSGDVESDYTVRARSAYFTGGNRWAFKNSNKSFVEGYVSGAPPMKLNVYLEVGGCAGIRSHDLKPVICILPDQAPLGQGNLGSHQNGSDISQTNSHFYEIFPDFKPILEYRIAALELECVATNHSYSWLSMGLNDIVANRGNTDLLNKAPISRQ